MNKNLIIIALVLEVATTAALAADYTRAGGSSGGISNPNTSNVIFSDPTKTLLLGASAIANLASTISGAQLLVSTRAGDTNYPFAVVGDYRNGVSGERYYSYIAQDGHYASNSYIALTGIGFGKAEECMQTMWADVPIVLSISNGIATDAGGGKLINGYGFPTAQSTWPLVFNVSSQGTVTISNPYGQTGSVQYDRPQFVLSDVGPNSAAPSWTYGSLHQKAGHLKIGTFNGTSTEGGELDISAGSVAITGTLSATAETISKTQDAPTGLLVSNASSGASAKSQIDIFNDSGNGGISLLSYSSGHSAYGALAPDTGGVYTNRLNGLVLMADGANLPIIFAAKGNSEVARFQNGLSVGNTTDPGAGVIFANKAIRTTAVTFANALTSPAEGTTQPFTDSTTATWGATITGGGANHVLGYWNGTNWTVAGK